MSAGGAAGAAAATLQATKASGVIVRVGPYDFMRIVERNDEPLVVHAPGGFFSGGRHLYLTSYRGLAFFTKSDMPLMLAANTEVVEAQKIWIPGS